MAVPVQIVGVGSALVDQLAHVADEFLCGLPGEKGGMALIDAAMVALLRGRFGQLPTTTPGGSAANTVYGLARLGQAAAFLGKVGNDEWAEFYRREFQQSGIDTSRMKADPSTGTGTCVVLITPDSQRTCRTFLGAAARLCPADIGPGELSGCRLVHVEGYLLFNRDLTLHILRQAREAGCQVSLDLASFEVVAANADVLETLLQDYVDIVFANEDEAAAFTGSRDPEAALAALGRCCETAAVKLGAEGAWLRRGGETARVDAVATTAVDTTGAGDLWAAGFLHGLLSGADLAACGRLGALLGAEVVAVTGPRIPEAAWPRLQQAAAELVAPLQQTPPTATESGRV